MIPNINKMFKLIEKNNHTCSGIPKNTSALNLFDAYVKSASTLSMSVFWGEGGNFGYSKKSIEYPTNKSQILWWLDQYSLTSNKGIVSREMSCVVLAGRTYKLSKFFHM